MKKTMVKGFLLLVIFIMLMGFPMLSRGVADLFPNPILDPDGSFWWISVHHIAQALMVIPFFVIVKWLRKDVDFGLTFGNKRVGMRYVLHFTMFFVVYTIIGFGIAFATNTFQPFQFDMTANNILGYLGFQLLLSGPSEELIFRAFAMGTISLLFSQRLFNSKISVANLIAAIIFGIAHISIYFFPFSYSYSLFQVFYAAALGLVYGDCFEKSKSVVYPMMLHSISNVIAVGATILATALVR